MDNIIHPISLDIIAGWWLGHPSEKYESVVEPYPSEKYEFVSWDYYPQYMGK